MNSKKPVEHIEEKIKQAAHNYQPSFDEKAWEAMEAKLDGDNKKRRPLLWWFLLPLLLAGGYGIYTAINKDGAKQKATGTANQTALQKQNDHAAVDANKKNDFTTTELNTPVAQDDNENDTAATVIERSSADKRYDNNDRTITSIGGEKTVQSRTGATTEKGNKLLYKKKGKLHTTSGGGEVGFAGEGNTTTATKESTAGETNAKEKARSNDKIKEVARPVEAVKEKEAAQDPLLVKEGDPKPGKEELDKKTGNKNAQQPAAAKPVKQKDNRQTGFYAQLTGGVDAGSMQLLSFDNSSFTGKFGIGLGYKFGKRWSAQTGFYITNKKYRATGADYTIKTGSPMAMYPIDKIKASCLVYEIPLAIKYDIISKPFFVLFGTAGVSSYIMQKEKYNCSYDYYGTTYENEWDYTGNKHLFSTVVFSLGIEKKLKGNMFLLAEPSISIPVNGVGDGKMKIYSSSLQAGLKYYFNRR